MSRTPAGPGSRDSKLYTGWEWSVGDPEFQFQVLLGGRDGSKGELDTGRVLAAGSDPGKLRAVPS